MKKDRRPTSAVSSHRTQEDVDPFDEDETERRFLESKPTCFIVFGKPGSGKTTFCKNLSRIWKCQLVNGPSSIAQAIELQTDLGKQAQEILQKGEILSEELTLKIVEERLKSPEVSHYGYVLDDFPYTSEEYLSVDDQFEFIKKLPLQPDFVINLRIPDEDLFHRRRGFRVDPLTNEIYTEERYNPPEVLEEETVEEEDDEDEGENVEADGDEDEESGDEEEEVGVVIKCFISSTSSRYLELPTRSPSGQSYVDSKLMIGENPAKTLNRPKLNVIPILMLWFN